MSGLRPADPAGKRRSIVRHGAILLSVLLSLSASPAMADPPNIENADHITGCLKTGRLLSFEISGWGLPPLWAAWP